MESSEPKTPAKEIIPNATSSNANENKHSSSSNADGLVGIGNCSSAKAYSTTLSALKVMDEQISVSTTAEDGARISVSGTPVAMANIVGVQATVITEVDAFVEQLNSELSAEGSIVDKIAVYDVTVIDHEGNETQPGDEVKVTITVPEFTADETAEVGAFHAKEFTEDSKTFEIEIKDADVNQAQGTVAMGTDSFSPVGAYTVVSANGNTYDENSWRDGKWVTDPIHLEPTTEGIQTTYIVEEIEREQYLATITFTIDNTVNQDELNINLDRTMEDIITDMSWMHTNEIQPGDRLQFKIIVVNNSDYDYQYADNSFTYTILDRIHATDTDDFHSFTGEVIPGDMAIWITGNTALAHLDGVDRVKQINDKRVFEKLCGQYTFTNNSGVTYSYNGLKDMSLYFIDFYNNKYNLNVTRLDEFSPEIVAEIVGFTPDKKETFDLDGVPLSIERKKFRTPNRELAELGYNHFYNSSLLAFMNVNDCTPSELRNYYFDNIQGQDMYSIGSYMRQYNNQECTLMEPYFEESFTNIAKDSTAELSHNMVLTLDGDRIKNAYQRYHFGPTFGFKLKKPPVDGTVTFNGTKVLTGREFTADDAYTFILKQDGVEVDRTTVKPAETPIFTLTDNLISGEEETQIVYTISEEGAGTTVNNVTYDSTVYTAAYDITVDDATNTVIAVYANGDNLDAGVTFTNVYNVPVTPPTPDRPSTGGGTGGGDGTPNGHRDTPETGGPGVTIEDLDVPLAPAPAETATTIIDSNVPLAPLPKTGQKNDGLMETLTMILSGFFLAASLLGRKRTKES